MSPPTNSCTTWPVRPGERVLVHGAAGGVGTALLDVGRILGADMYGVAAPRDHALVREHGAQPVHRGRESAHRADVVLDMIGGATLRHSWHGLRPGGRLVSYSFLSTDAVPVRDLLQLRVWNVLPNGRRAAFYRLSTNARRHPDRIRATLERLLTELGQGGLRPRIAARVPSTSRRRHTASPMIRAPGARFCWCRDKHPSSARALASAWRMAAAGSPWWYTRSLGSMLSRNSCGYSATRASPAARPASAPDAPPPGRPRSTTQRRRGNGPTASTHSPSYVTTAVTTRPTRLLPSAVGFSPLWDGSSGRVRPRSAGPGSPSRGSGGTGTGCHRSGPAERR